MKYFGSDYCLHPYVQFVYLIIQLYFTKLSLDPVSMTMIQNHNSNFFNTLRLRPNGSHFADDSFKRIFLNDNV